MSIERLVGSFLTASGSRGCRRRAPAAAWRWARYRTAQKLRDVLIRRPQVLPALPEKGVSTSVRGGEPEALYPLDTLEAHQKGAAVMAASPDGRFMATGGADGLVCLWMVYENQARGHALGRLAWASPGTSSTP